MGVQQLLLLILITIIVGLGLQIGLSLFESYNQDGDRDRLSAQVSNIVAYFEACSKRTRSMAGGGGSFNGCTAPRKLLQSAAGTFVCVPSGNWLTVVGTGNVPGRDNEANTRITAIYSNGQTSVFVNN